MSETQKGAAQKAAQAEETRACGRAAELDELADTLFGGHEALEHADEQEHHHHTHAPASHHEHGHHLLQVEDLSVGFRMYDEDAPFFRARQRFVEVISSLTISVHAGEIVAVVGASGSGKTLLADAVLGLFEPNATVRGRIWFDGELQDAAGLAANPRYLVADEVSTMLDALTQAQIWRFLVGETSRRGIGLVFVSHSPALTDRIATRVVRLGA